MAAAVLEFLPRGSGKSALQWHVLMRESRAAGRPIVCVECRRPHEGPPKFGRCACGSYAYGIKTAAAQQPALDFHGGEA